MRSLRPLALCLVLVGCNASTTDFDPSSAEAGLLEAVEGVAPFHASVVRAREVRLAFDPTEGARSPDEGTPRPSLRLNLFADAVYDARLERMRRLEHGVVWEGVVAGAEGSSVVIAVDDGGAIAATVRVGNARIGRRLFSLTPRGGGVLAVEWDESAAPQDHASVTPRALAPSFRVPTRPEPSPDADVEVDVLVVYSAEAAHAAGSESALRATVELAVTEANRAFDESGVAGRVALAGFEPVEYDETGFDFERALRELSTPGDGQLDDVQELRDAYGADHVVFVIDHAGPYAGIGYQLTAGNASFFEPAAYAVVSRDYAAGHYTFAHELGHNFGANHDPAHASDGWRVDSHGHQDPAHEFRTIMAYSCDGSWCGRVGRWSNPGALHEGHPTGVAGVSDNARTLRERMGVSAGYRERPVPPPDFATLVQPVEGATLPAGEVRFTWNDVGASAYYLMLGASPGDDRYYRGHLGGASTTHAVRDLPEGGEAIFARLWTLKDGAWRFSDHRYIAHRGAFRGARLGMPGDGETLSTTWSWFGWRTVDGASEYRLEVGTETDPGRYADQALGLETWALVAGLPADGSQIVARLSTRGPSGWVVEEARLTAWRAPEHASVILAPPSGSTLDASVVFEVSESTASARWIVVRDAHSLLAVQPIAGRVVRVDGLPTDGRALIAQVYSLGPDGWVSTTAAYRAR
ncbi:MAG: M12 family metallo-peptidase [Sandaracinaceae bacterium]